MKQSVVLVLGKSDITSFFSTRDLKRWNKDLAVYGDLRKNLHRAHKISDYERKFNYFYQVRRNARWRKKFYAIFYAQASRGKGGKRAKRTDFGEILTLLLKATGQVEASFASKMAATLDPNLPIIDRHVLSYIGRTLPPVRKRKSARENKKNQEERVRMVTALHKEMELGFNAFLKTPTGRYLVTRFRREHPDSTISEMKMLDFVLWQSGGKKGSNSAAR